MIWLLRGESKRHIGRNAVITALAACLAALGTVAANAEVIVVQSTAPGLNAGTVLSDDTNLTIPKGAKAIFVLPSGKTRTVSGPFKGRASDLTRGVRANPGVFDAVRRYVETGGSNQRNVGAVRSAVPASASAKPLPFSWSAVPITASGDYCVKKGANVSLIRSRVTSQQAITIIHMASKRRARVAFKAGADSTAWPDKLAIDPGATYALLTDGRPARKLRMRTISPLPAREDTLQVLHGQRCESQFRALIRQMQASR